jgi:hypothetical protein
MMCGRIAGDLMAEITINQGVTLLSNAMQNPAYIIKNREAGMYSVYDRVTNEYVMGFTFRANGCDIY